MLFVRMKKTFSTGEKGTAMQGSSFLIAMMTQDKKPYLTARVPMKCGAD